MTASRRLGWKKALALAAGSFVLLVLGFVGVGYAVTDVPKPDDIATEQGTRIVYADGGTLGRVGKNRTLVSLSKVSVPAQRAVLAAEDRGYYTEPGISFKGIGRALVTNLRGGGVSQGGSTVTQQYAKNALGLTSERTFSRKIKEVFIALKLSKTVSKDKVLEDYLNTIYFGRGAYGIEAAAQTYFKTPAASLTAEQGAVLAASIRSPAGYDPSRHAERAQQRWAYVLDGMVKQNWLPAEERATATYPKVQAPGTGLLANAFPGYRDYIRDQVLTELERQGFPEDRITAGGFVVHTTLRRDAEAAAVAAVEDAIPAPTGAHPPVAALVSVQPGTGAVIAYYGGRQAGQFDYASGGNGVQPGSSLKPYVLAAALEKGIGLDTQLDGSSPQQVCGDTVTNDQGDPPLGRVDLATGLALSVNTVYTRLACQVGPKRVADLAHAAGIPATEKLDGGDGRPSQQIALGSGGYEVHVIDQATGFATFAAGGTRARPYFVASVTQNRRTVYRAKSDTGRAVSAGVAADTTYAMRKVVTDGTGTRAQLNGRPAAGKTGTTGNNANAWFCGFTPQLATAVWVGRQGGGSLKGVLGSSRGVYGGTVPAQIFKTYMDRALQGQPVKQFPPRAGVGQAQAPTSVPTTAAPQTPSATATTSPTTSPTPRVSAPPVPTVTVPPVAPTSAPPAVTRTEPPAASPTGAAPAVSPAAGAAAQAQPTG